MKISQQQIEAVVQEVVRRLRSKGIGNRGARSSSESADITNTGRHNSSLSVMRLDGRVISLSSIGKGTGGWDRVQTVEVGERAIITPSVRDELRDRNIEVRRVSNVLSERELGPLLVACHGTDWSVERWLTAHSERVGGHEQLELDCIIQIRDELQRRLQNGTRRAVIFTSQPALALCVANRKSPIKAAWATSGQDVATAQEQLDVNVLVVNPQGRDNFELLRMIQQLQRVR